MTQKLPSTPDPRDRERAEKIADKHCPEPLYSVLVDDIEDAQSSARREGEAGASNRLLESAGWTVQSGGTGESGYWVQVRGHGRVFHCEHKTPELAMADAVERAMRCLVENSDEVADINKTRYLELVPIYEAVLKRLSYAERQLEYLKKFKGVAVENALELAEQHFAQQKDSQ